MKKILVFAVLAMVMAFGISCSKQEQKKADVEKVVKQEAPRQGGAEAAPTVEAKDEVKAPDPVVPEIPVDPNTEYVVGKSIYTGWAPWWYIEESVIKAKWEARCGIKIKFKQFDYVPSIQAYSNMSGDVHACVMTNMDALAMPALGGVDSEVIIVGDYSNGNDGIVARQVSKVSELAGHKIYLVDGSVSIFLVYRALMMEGNGLKVSDLTFENVTLDSQIQNIYTSNPEVIAATWNPILMGIMGEPNSKMLFDSSKIPGEILDLMVVKANAPTALKKALVGMWYDAMADMTVQGPRRQETILALARSQQNTLQEYQGQLNTTRMYYTPAEAVAFTKAPELIKVMDMIRAFYFDFGLLPGATSKDQVGISFPDGTVLGDKDNVKLHFVTEYMQLAADGAL